MQAIEFLQGLGWACVAAYCLNNLGLVPSSWIDVIQSKAGLPQSEAVSSPNPTTSPTANPTTSPSPTETPQESGSDDKQFSIK
jgi:hypothetical protein